MSRDLKLYVPVMMPGGKTIMIGIHKSLVFQKVVPSKEIIRDYLNQQVIIMRQSIPFISIKISLSRENFDPLRKELSRKCGGSYRSSVIDIISESSQKPLIQIIQKNE